MVAFLLYGMYTSFRIVLQSVLITCTECLFKRRGLSSVATSDVARSAVSTHFSLQKGDCHRSP